MNKHIELPALSDDEIDDLSWSEFESAVAMGISVDSFKRLAKTVRNRMAAAIAAHEARVVGEPVAWKQGSLVTVNQDPYPSLGGLFAQFWDGEEVAARVYANDHETLRTRCAVLATAPAPQEAQADSTPLLPVARIRSWTKHGEGHGDLVDWLEGSENLPDGEYDLYLGPQSEQKPVASIYISPNGEREFDDWKHDLPIGRNELYAAPVAQPATEQAEAPSGQQGEFNGTKPRDREDDTRTSQDVGLNASRAGEQSRPGENQHYQHRVGQAGSDREDDHRNCRGDGVHGSSGVSAQPEPYGQVTTHCMTGQQFFYRWPEPPYLDNASECVTVFATQPTASNAGERWIERWHGSPTHQGWSIMAGRERVAYLGEGPKSNEVSAIVAAHNAALASKPVAPPAREALSFNCSNGCGACGVKLVDFVTHATQAQDSDQWITVASEPQLVSNCCGSAVEVWDERKQDIVGEVSATTPAPAGQDWLPLSEAPKDGSWFLAGEGATGRVRMVRWSDYGGDRYPINDEERMWATEPTKFLPLPKLNKEAP